MIKLRKNFHIHVCTISVKFAVYENFLTTKNSEITVQQNFLLWQKHQVENIYIANISVDQQHPNKMKSTSKEESEPNEKCRNFEFPLKKKDL